MPVRARVEEGLDNAMVDAYALVADDYDLSFVHLSIRTHVEAFSVLRLADDVAGLRTCWAFPPVRTNATEARPSSTSREGKESLEPRGVPTMIALHTNVLVRFLVEDDPDPVVLRMDDTRSDPRCKRNEADSVCTRDATNSTAIPRMRVEPLDARPYPRDWEKR